MESIVQEDFKTYILKNNPELVLNQMEGYSFAQLIHDKMAQIRPVIKQLLTDGVPKYLVSEICHTKLIAEFKPSKFNYIKEILETEFPDENYMLKDAGILTYEVVNLIQICTPVFMSFGFDEDNEDNRFLRYAIIAEVHDYLLDLVK